MLRGYNPDDSKWAILKRELLTSWAQPGFYQFWQVWNPGVGYLLFRGRSRKRKTVATVCVFMVCGLLHDVAFLLMFRRPFMAFSAAFLCFGVLVVVSRKIQPWLRQDRRPPLVNVVVNILLVALSVQVGVTLQRALPS